MDYANINALLRWSSQNKNITPIFWEILHFISGAELKWLTVCSLCILTVCNFSYFRFLFEGGIRVLISPVPVRCLFFTLPLAYSACFIMPPGSDMQCRAF